MQLPVRGAVVASPEYPFAPVSAPVKLDQNESFADFPADLKARALERLAQIEWNRYPDLNSDALSDAIARFEDWPAPGTVVATGSNVLIPLLIQLSALDSRVVTVKPNFALYGLDAKLLGAPLTEVPLRKDFSVDIDALIAALAPDGSNGATPRGVIYLPRPHAPTGSICSLEQVERLAAASAGWLLVIDEAYHQFADSTAAAIARRHPHVVLLRTFSKAWGLAGARLGYALAAEPVGRQLRKLVAPFAVSVMQTVCAEEALARPDYMRARVAATVRERERVYAALLRHPSWRVYASHANFLLMRTPDAAMAHRKLLDRGILVRRQDSYFGLDGCIRVTIGSREENDAFLAAVGVPAT